MGGGHTDKARTPLAWQHRQKYQEQQQRMESSSAHAGDTRPRSMSSGSSEYTDSSVFDRLAVERVPQDPSRRKPPFVPLQTWDGEPCPVHGAATMMPRPLPIMRRAYEYEDQMPMPPPVALHPGYRTMPPAPLPPPPPPGPEMFGRVPSPGFLPPMMRPRPVVIPAEGRAPPEPLPMRDPEKGKSAIVKQKFPTPHTQRVKICCGGGWMCFLWIIISVIIFSVLLAVILRLVIP